MPEATAADVPAALVGGVRRCLLLVPLLLLLGNLPAGLADRDVYRPAWVVFAAWSVLVLVAATGAALALCATPPFPTRPFDDRRRWIALSLILTTTVLAEATVPPLGLLGPGDWPWTVAGWFALPLLLDGPPAVMYGALAGQAPLVGGYLILAGRPGLADLAQFGALGTLNFGAQAAFGAAGRLAASIGAAAEEIATRDADLQTAGAVAEQIQADRQARYAEIAATAAPLLNGLRSGRLRPSDPTTRRLCSIEAARLRRLMAESDNDAEPLMHELEACASIAERAGVRVDLALRGTLPLLDLPVRRSLTEPVIEALAQARSHARLTVVSGNGQVIVSVFTDVVSGASAPPGPPAPRSPGDRPTVTLDVMRTADRVLTTILWERR